MGDMLGGQKSKDGLGQIISGLGSLMAGQNQVGGDGGGGGGGIDLSLVGDLISGFSSITGGGGGGGHQKRSHGSQEQPQQSSGFDFDSLLNIASAFMGQSGNAEGVMGLLPLVLDTFSGGHSKGGHDDHSDHSWFMPPILENAHLMWDHFRLVPRYIC